MPKAILEIKLGRPYEMPRRRLDVLLEDARRACCIARNAAVTHWLVWRWQHPDWEPGGEYDAPPRKIARKPNANATTPKDPPYAPREFLSRELYGVACAYAPNLNTKLCSACVKEVNSKLKSNTPYNHDGPSRYVWQAILNAEVSLATWRAGRIPMPRAATVLHADESEAWIRFPLLSKKSGYRVLSPKVRLHVSDLSGGRKRIWRKLASGEWRLADSQLYEKKGEWYAQLSYDHPSGAKIDSDRVLTLQLAEHGAAKPFRLEWTDDEGKEVSILFGKAAPLVAEYRRVQSRRRAIRWRYKDGAGSGHGRGHFYKSLKPMERHVRDMCGRWQKQFVSDVIKLAEREGCGSIRYLEPSSFLRSPPNNVRAVPYFVKEDVPFDWTQFSGRLKHRAEVKGFAFSVEKFGYRDWKPSTEDVKEIATGARSE